MSKERENDMNFIEHMELILGHELTHYQKAYIRGIEKLPPDSKLVVGRGGRTFVVKDTKQLKTS